MKLSGHVAGIVAAIGFVVFLICDPAQSNAAVLGLSCIGVAASPYYCEDGNTNSLRNNGNSGSNATVAGALEPGDGGGGDFYDLGLASSNPVLSPVCLFTPPGSPLLNGTGTVGSTTIYPPSGFVNYTNLHVGEAVSGGNTAGISIQIPQGAEIASIVPPHGSAAGYLTLTIPLVGTATGSQLINIAVSADNGGTLITDNGSPQQCWQKTNYRGDPHEFGAYGDGNTDDTVWLENWLGAYGNVNSTLPPNKLPANFGPWMASIPATYLVSQPLVCPQYANLQAGANISAGQPGNNAGGPNPLVTILAQQPTTGGSPVLANTLAQPALIMASQYCRISGIAINADGNGNYLFPGLTGSAGSSTGTTVSLSSAAPSGVVPGMPLSDTGGCIPSGAVITAVNNGSTPPNLTISVPATGSCGTGGSGDSITITGFYAVDVVGTHVGIDNHTLIKQGYQNIRCGDTTVDGLQIKESQIFGAINDGIHLANGCSNARLIDDIIQSNGNDGLGSGVYDSGSDMSLESGIVETTGGRGIYLTGADLAVISGMTLTANANSFNPAVTAGTESYPYPAIQIDSSSDITVSGSWIKGTGTDTQNSSSGLVPLAADILFTGTSNNISVSGNVYPAVLDGAENAVPAYIYDAEAATTSSPAPVLTNSHIYETAQQPAVAVFSASAQPILQPLMVPQFTSNQIGGLTLSNSSSTAPSQQIYVAPGSATDSTNSTVIQITSPCLINLANPNGVNGLDTGSVAANTTYFIYVISAAAAGNVATPSCMASASATAPLFSATSFGGSGYVLFTHGGSFSGGTTVYNVNNLTGVSAGEAVWDSGTFTTAGTKINQFSANAAPSPQPMGTWIGQGVGVPTTVTICTSGTCTTGIYPGMAIQGNGCIPASSYVSAVSLTNIQVSYIPSSCTSASSGASYSQLSISGARQIVLNNGAANTNSRANLNIATAYYRLVGALYTDSSGNFVQFTQDGDTFYLNTPAIVPSVALGTTPVAMALPSVPSGVSVKAFGRCVGGAASGTHHVLILSPAQAATGSATGFSTPPGYDVASLAPSTVYPFSAWTAPGGYLLAVTDSSLSGISVQCMSDGWVWHRSQ